MATLTVHKTGGHKNCQKPFQNQLLTTFLPVENALGGNRLAAVLLLEC
jgi:hypothetical protein